MTHRSPPPLPVVFRFVLALGITSVLAVLNASSLSAQPSINTLPQWNGVTSAPWLTRDFSSASIGQTFTTPTNASALNGLSLFLGYSPISFPFDQDLRFHAYLFGWNGTALTDLLWRSPAHDGATEIALAQRAFNVGGAPLAAGGQYAVVLSTLEADPFDPNLAFQSMFPAYQNVGLVDSDAYAGGALILSYADNWADLRSTPWFVDQSSDLAINLTFAPRTNVVPEPSSLVLTAFALLLLVPPVARRASRRASR